MIFSVAMILVVSGLWGMIENDLPVLKEKGATVAFDFATRPDDPVSVKAIPYVDYVSLQMMTRMKKN